MTVVEHTKHVGTHGRREGFQEQIDQVRMQLRAADDERVVVLRGDLDPRRAPAFRAALAAALAESDDVHADLSEVRSLDPSGIRELLRAQALAARLGKSR